MNGRAGSWRRDTGAHGEDLATRWYLAHGYEVVDRNWRCPEGELDIVARRDGTVVFCEVRTRTSDRFGTGAESVTPSKRRRLRRLAGRWLAGGNGRQLRPSRLRFDVASLTGGVLEVIQDAF